MYNKSKLFLIKSFITDGITGNIIELSERRFRANIRTFYPKYDYK